MSDTEDTKIIFTIVKGYIVNVEEELGAEGNTPLLTGSDINRAIDLINNTPVASQ